MIFQTNSFIVDTISPNDYDEILTLYNTNSEFLEKHLSLSQLSRGWLESEMKSMKEIDFISLKIIDITTGNILGVLDYKLDTDAYLSILIFHKDSKGRGIGSLFIEHFFKYLKSMGTVSVGIDVVTGYNEGVINFWKKHGFHVATNTTLNWNDNLLPAVKMIKYL